MNKRSINEHIESDVCRTANHIHAIRIALKRLYSIRFQPHLQPSHAYALTHSKTDRKGAWNCAPLQLRIPWAYVKRMLWTTIVRWYWCCVTHTLAAHSDCLCACTNRRRCCNEIQWSTESQPPFTNTHARAHTNAEYNGRRQRQRILMHCAQQHTICCLTNTHRRQEQEHFHRMRIMNVCIVHCVYSNILFYLRISSVVRRTHTHSRSHAHNQQHQLGELMNEKNADSQEKEMKYEE